LTDLSIWLVINVIIGGDEVEGYAETAPMRLQSTYGLFDLPHVLVLKL